MVALGDCGRLRMGVHDLIPYSFLANLIGRYRDDYPSVDLEIAEDTGGRQSRNCVRVSSTSRSRSGRPISPATAPDVFGPNIWSRSCRSTIHSAAFALGFTSDSVFIAFFKRMTGYDSD
ncbi:hypothetical protein [Brucella cytisi]|uniref:hypothetical protein n=1 Tax=Brucella cytisi TaxID=407152 RepID=UPI004041EDFF